jgi:protein gp37
MSANTTIEWTEKTWNPIAGCTVLSPGCHRCYARTMALRLAGVAAGAPARGRDPGRLRHYLDVTGDGDWNGKIVPVPEALAEPLGWDRPQTVFVNSMSDLFHKDAPQDFVERVCRVMERADWHTYQVLTKRSSLLRNALQGRLRFAAALPHVWWGVSVEDRVHGLPRVEHLRQAPAAVRFLSVEPLLEDLGEINLEGIHWVIVGGESGPSARPVREEWVRSIRDQCARAGVPFFFKQWGGRNKKAAGRLLEGRTHDGMPPRPTKPVAPRAQRRAWMTEFGGGDGEDVLTLGLLPRPSPAT